MDNGYCLPGYTGEYECTVNYPGKPGLILILEKKSIVNKYCLFDHRSFLRDGNCFKQTVVGALGIRCD